MISILHFTKSLIVHLTNDNKMDLINLQNNKILIANLAIKPTTQNSQVISKSKDKSNHKLTHDSPTKNKNGLQHMILTQTINT
jgi:hypothetical protein